MSYVLPSQTAADATWYGTPAYTRPAQSAADATWSAGGATGTGAGTLTFTGAATAAHGISGAGLGVIDFTGAGVGVLETGIEGAGAGSLEFAGAGVAAHGIAATGAGGFGFTGAGVAVHPRYEVRGEVRLGGILVNRLVRCYQRSTGALLGQADTVAGLYAVHAGFDASEVYVTAIDTADDATDWLPPTANRLVPVLVGAEA